MAAIPVVDLAPFWQDKGVVVGRMPTKDQLSVASQIDEANREFGFIAVRNFGLSKAEVETYFRAAKKLFALSPESKDTLIAAEVLDTGYVAPNRQEVNHRGLQAPKESYLVGNDAGYLNCPAAFRTSSGKLYSRLDELNKRYCAATALALGLRDTNIVWSMHQSSDLVRIRYNHYPPLNSQEIQDFPAVRFGAHTDFGTQTFLLLQGGANGLEIQPPGLQDWIEAKVPEDIFCVINIGDMWETMTNGRWKAVRHRVMIRNKEQALAHRYSIACFLNPRRDLRVAPLSKFTDAREACTYKAFMAGEYLFKQIDKISKAVYVIEERECE